MESELADLEPKQRQLALINELLKLYDPASQEGKPFTGMSVSVAIQRYLKGCPGHFATRLQIKDALLSGGITSDADSFSAVLAVQLSRLRESKKIIRVNSGSEISHMRTLPGGPPPSGEK